MKRWVILILALCLMACLFACGADEKQEQPAAEPKAEAAAKSAAEPAAAPVTELAVEPTTAPTAAPTAAPTTAPAVPSVHPYAWLGYQDIPACAYLDAISKQVYYCAYEMYTLGYKVPCAEASDGVNVYTYDGTVGTLSLILDGMVYSLGTRSLIYMFRDMKETYQATLDERLQLMEQGIDKSGKVFQGTGSGQIPLYCDFGDTNSYEYYEYFTDGQYPLTRRVYMKDGDVFAVYDSYVDESGKTQETAQVITELSASPDPALFALPDNFSEYKLYE